MDKITGFADDELLVKILSFLPTKDAVSTSVLSKQWKFLWMRVPNLHYKEKSIYPVRFYFRYKYCGEADCNRIYPENSQRMRRFIDRNLPLHRSPVIQSLRLSFFTVVFQPQDIIRRWIDIAISRCVQELRVKICPHRIKPNALLPSSLYTCKSLVTLKLKHNILVDVPHVVSLPSLKALHLRRVTYTDAESLQRLFSNCTVLEDLVMVRCQGDNLRKFSVIIPSLVTLYLMVNSEVSSDGYMIDTPSLKYFEVIDKSSTCVTLKNMPMLEEAKIYAAHNNIKNLLQPVTSVKRLSLWVEDHSAEVIYGDDIVFTKLEHLNFRIFKTYWSKLLFWLLNACPELRDFTFVDHFSRDTSMGTLVCWKQLNSVPQCLLSTLQTFQWTGFLVSVEGKDLATYVLRNSCLLKTATISLGPGLDPQKNLDFETEVKLSSRSSPTCNLVFDKLWHL